MRAAIEGDSAAYRSLLTALTPWLRALVRKGLTRAGRSVDDCEDIVQEALLAVHLKRHTWDHSQPLEPWVRAIAGYKLVDHLRRRGNTVHVTLDDLVDVLPAAQQPDVGQDIDRERLLSTLPDRHRRVVEAIAVEGHSAREVAAALGMSEGSVRVTLHRALKAMGDVFRRGST